MGKSAGKGDPTMPLSKSQVVAVTPRPPKVPKGDVSSWKRLVVPADEFAPKQPESRLKRWMVFGVLGAGVAAGGGYALYAGSKDAKDAHQPAPPSAAVAPEPPDARQPAALAPPVDAAVAVAPPDAPP